jgi:hypothetical protein
LAQVKNPGVGRDGRFAALIADASGYDARPPIGGAGRSGLNHRHGGQAANTEGTKAQHGIDATRYQLHSKPICGLCAFARDLTPSRKAREGGLNDGQQDRRLRIGVEFRQK